MSLSLLRYHLTLSSQFAPDVLGVYLTQHMQNALIRGLATSILRVFIKQVEGLARFFSVIYWIILKHFNRILSTRCSDLTTQAFGLFFERRVPHRPAERCKHQEGDLIQAVPCDTKWEISICAFIDGGGVQRTFFHNAF